LGRGGAVKFWEDALVFSRLRHKSGHSEILAVVLKRSYVSAKNRINKVQPSGSECRNGEEASSSLNEWPVSSRNEDRMSAQGHMQAFLGVAG
jgi:hypothetical protein